MLKKNDIVSIKIESLTSLGSGVGRYNDFVIFVSNSAPGDEINCRIIKLSKNYAIGKIEEILTPSPHRIPTDCPAVKSCGGCSFRQIDYNEELRQKLMWVNDDIRKNAHIDFTVNEIIGAADTLRYRNKAIYPVKIENGHFTAGFYAFKSHRIIECNDCLLHPEEFNAVIQVFKNWAENSNITSYDETTNTGLLRNIYIRKAFGTDEIMVIAVINGNSIPNSNYLIKQLCAVSGNIKCIGININKKQTNTVLGKETHILWGNNQIKDKLLNKTFLISPESFYQVNHDMCEALYTKIRELAALDGNQEVVDLYCGTGTIGLSLAEQCKKLTGIEITPSAVENARENADINNIKNAEFICADASLGAKQILSRGDGADLVIVDPPRKGCNSKLFDVIEALGAKRIIYVSCNSATLARDIERLSPKGFMPKSITAFDLFPRTANVECVCLLEK